MLAKLMRGPAWDLVFPSAEFIPPMRDMGIVQPLCHADGSATSTPRSDVCRSKWGSATSLVPVPRTCMDPTGIAYQKNSHPEPRAWADLWDGAIWRAKSLCRRSSGSVRRVVSEKLKLFR